MAMLYMAMHSPAAIQSVLTVTILPGQLCRRRYSRGDAFDQRRHAGQAGSRGTSS